MKGPDKPYKNNPRNNKKAIDIVHELLKNTITDFEYKKENNRTYASFTFRTKRRNYA